MEPKMKRIEEYSAAAQSIHAPCGLVKWSLPAILVVLLLAPRDTVSLDCGYATALFEDATKECEAGVKHEGVTYQPCELAKLLEPNYRICTGAPPVEEPQSEFGLIMIVDRMIGSDGLVAAASQEGFKQAKLTALKSCLAVTGKTRRCKELDRFGEVCFAVAEAQYGTKNDFVTAKGNSRGAAEIGAIRWCKEYVPESKLWARHCNLMPSKCSSDEIQCGIKASGCSPYEVVDSMKKFKFRAAQTLEEVSKMHKKPAVKSGKPKTKDPIPDQKKIDGDKIVRQFHAIIRAQQFKERFGLRLLELEQKREAERKNAERKRRLRNLGLVPWDERKK